MTGETLTFAKLDAMVRAVKALPPPEPTIRVVPSWVRAWVYHGPPGRCPSKAAGRRGTRRDWKLRHGWRSGWRYQTVEPDHVLRFEHYVLMTQRQFDSLKRMVPERTPVDSGLFVRY